MADKMTITEAIEAFDLYELYEEILDGYETDFDIQAGLETEIRDLIEEHDEFYEFSPDDDGGYAESFERNLKEAVDFILDAHGLDMVFDDDFSDEAMDDEDIAGIYNDGLEDDSLHGRGGFDDDDDLY